MSRKKKNPALRKPYTSTFLQSRTRIIPSCLKSESRNCSSCGAYRRHVTVIFYLLANTEIPRHVQTYRRVVAEILARQHPYVAIHSHFRPVIEHTIVAEVYVQLVFQQRHICLGIEVEPAVIFIRQRLCLGRSCKVECYAIVLAILKLLLVEKYNEV